MEAGVGRSDTTIVECPVCPRGALPAGRTTCPNCRTDLGPLARLSVLAALLGGTNAVPAPARQSSGWFIAAGTIILATGVAVGTRVAPTGQVRLATPTEAPVSLPEDPSEPATPGPSLDALAATLDRVEDIAVERTPTALLLIPRKPLFPRGSAVPSRRATVLSRTLAEALQLAPRGLRVHLEGHTDAATVRPSGRWSDNWSLGLARALAMAEQLRSAWGESRLLRETTFQITSAGAQPRPGDVAAQRTVIMRLTVDALVASD